MTLTDRFGRSITYLRISVTDRCNLRCVYCLPGDGVTWQAREDQLSAEEIARVTEAAARVGVRRVRLTGGEPLTPLLQKAVDAKPEGHELVWVRFISVESLRRVTCCVLRKPSKRNTRHREASPWDATEVSLNSFACTVPQAHVKRTQIKKDKKEPGLCQTPFLFERYGIRNTQYYPFRNSSSDSLLMR
jgi:organic radical activating enzyme